MLSLFNEIKWSFPVVCVFVSACHWANLHAHYSSTKVVFGVFVVLVLNTWTHHISRRPIVSPQVQLKIPNGQSKPIPKHIASIKIKRKLRQKPINARVACNMFECILNECQRMLRLINGDRSLSSFTSFKSTNWLAFGAQTHTHTHCDTREWVRCVFNG